MAIIKHILKTEAKRAQRPPFVQVMETGGSCKWCAQGECWSHGQVSKGKVKGAARGNGKGGFQGAKGGGSFGAGIFQGQKGLGKGGGGRSGGGASFAAVQQVKALMNEWVEAKQARDFQTSDRIREDLRSLGIDPDEKDNGRGNNQSGGRGNKQGGALMNAWIEAKRAGDYQTSDQIRETLRSLGIDPDEANNGRGNTQSGRRGNKQGGALMEEWIEAKRAKDYETADRIREELRAQGIRPGEGDNPRGKRGILRSFATEVKVWVGGLPADSTGKEINMALKDHMAQAGDCRYVEIGKTGSGGAAFSTADEAINAITMLNGSQFGGVVIEVDVWTPKEGE